MAEVINSIFKDSGISRRVTSQEVVILIKQMDGDKDGRISKEELYQLLKKVHSK